MSYSATQWAERGGFRRAFARFAPSSSESLPLGDRGGVAAKGRLLARHHSAADFAERPRWQRCIDSPTPRGRTAISVTRPCLIRTARSRQHSLGGCIRAEWQYFGSRPAAVDGT